MLPHVNDILKMILNALNWCFGMRANGFYGYFSKCRFEREEDFVVQFCLPRRFSHETRLDKNNKARKSFHSDALGER